jgi:alpha-amylase/alpha-mannosidase (GH57 family)
MRQTYVMLLWHMHQPFYKDLAENLYTMPWVRLHGLKDYYGMVSMLSEFPSVRVTVNMVPSLVAQLQDYGQGKAREPEFETVCKPAADLTPEERSHLLEIAFQLNWENLLNRYARFKELHDRVLNTEEAQAARFFTTQDLLDLQVLSQLAWFDEIYLAEDPEIRNLVSKQRGYSEDDKSILCRKEIEILNKILEVCKELDSKGQIELSTSPFYHPILPLLCDTNIAAESHPGVRLPRRPFRHPEDARAQLRAAVEFHEQVFGRRPWGLWPSEGSVSDEVLALAAAEGFKWAATDEGVLGRSLQIDFQRQPDGTTACGYELYRPHRFEAGGNSIALFFRDHQISDLIGFVYSRMEPQAAAADLHHRIRAAGRSAGDRPAVISIILDGENAWEFFPRNGRDFLKSFYRRVGSDPEIRMVTASEALEVTEPGKLTHVVPGSWINANFDVWIGADEDNRAWDLLSDARDFFAREYRNPKLDPAQVKLAEQELWIAEGSDWCWWYGPEHSSAHDAEFDLLFRKHLSNIYRLLGGSPPDELAVPIKRPKGRATHMPPTALIEPCIDGLVTNYFEWLGAGVYVPDYRSGSMHGGARILDALYYGHGASALYLRLDLSEQFLRESPTFEVRVKTDEPESVRLHAIVSNNALGLVQFWKGTEHLLVPLATGTQVQAAFHRVFELRLAYSLLGVAATDRVRLQVSLWVDELPVQVIPQDDLLTLELAEEPVVW